MNASDIEGISGRGVLSAEGLRLAARLLTGATCHEDTPGLAELAGLGLVVRDPASGGYAAADLRHAERASLEAGRTAIVAHLAQMSAVTKAVLALEALSSGENREGAPVFLATPEQANASISQALEAASDYVHTAQPTPRPEGALRRSADRDIEIMSRGVKYRTIYSDSARTRPAERAWASEVSAHGAEVRTLAADFERIIIIDGRAAFISNCLGEPGNKQGYMITHPATVAFLAAGYQQQWDRAEPWLGGRRQSSHTTITTARTREILRAMMAGQTDKQIATHLGLSERTVTTEVGKLYEAVRVETRFQLGAWWESSPERQLD
ncbi:helix-turn-helix transcriptional regulator [Streptomyces buecherae]|uniref:helix-turn-helix transcriptional regulator n=1 Tax=Streptomyces buecherae TaxID=2763006 RepID=UPI0037A7D7B7